MCIMAEHKGHCCWYSQYQLLTICFLQNIRLLEHSLPTKHAHIHTHPHISLHSSPLLLRLLFRNPLRCKKRDASYINHKQGVPVEVWDGPRAELWDGLGCILHELEPEAVTVSGHNQGSSRRYVSVQSVTGLWSFHRGLYPSFQVVGWSTNSDGRRLQLNCQVE